MITQIPSLFAFIGISGFIFLRAWQKLSFLFLSSSSCDAFLFGLLDRSVSLAHIRFELVGEQPHGRRVFNVGTNKKTEKKQATSSSPDEPDLVVRVTDRNFSRRILTSGNLGLAESWMSGGFTMERGTLEEFLFVLIKSKIDETLRRSPLLLFKIAIMRVVHFFQSKESNVQRHYDVGNDIYELILDETMAYTCGYQLTENDTLRQLQDNKHDLICKKLRLLPNQKLLDIGCGWGGLLIHAATKYKAKAHGITISKQQFEYVQNRVRKLGLEDLVTVQYGNYAEAKGVYDKIVCIEMMEHLYPSEHDTYFHFVKEHLAPGGMGLVHVMSSFQKHNDPDPFIQTYVFPASTHPNLSSLLRSMETNLLPVLDVENIVHSYLPTTRYWLENWREKVNEVDKAKYDDRFVLMFEYLLCIYVAASQARVSSVYHVLYTKDDLTNLSFTRI